MALIFATRWWFSVMAIGLWFAIAFIAINVQLILADNRMPYFLPHADLSNFSLSESTPVGTIVYKLQGIDPENKNVFFSISGPDFIVDTDTGEIKLQKPLDREKNPEIEVIITIRDKEAFGFEPNIVSLRRLIQIVDENDNVPELLNLPYIGTISESASVNSLVLFGNSILISDIDSGLNADLDIVCHFNQSSTHANTCDLFEIIPNKVSEGKYVINVRLKGILDYENRSLYNITIKITDKSFNPHSISGSITVQVLDVQDEPPIFFNAPYAATVPENMDSDVPILTILANDGDATNKRPIYLEIEDEVLNYFYLNTSHVNDEEVLLMTSDLVIDKEHAIIQQNQGIYTFKVKATEIIDDQLTEDYSYTNITIVILDEDDHKPEFDKDLIEISVPEDVTENSFLPDLKLIVDDKDSGANSQYNLSIVDVKNSKGVFDIVNKQCAGRQRVVIKVINNLNFDYDVEIKPVIIFDIVASVRNRNLSKSRVIINSFDVNDNIPSFDQDNYRFKVFENSAIGSQIGILNATDIDSGNYGYVTYLIKGYGVENFEIDPLKGILKVKRNLDYENQKFYTLTVRAKDGGDKISYANLLIEVIDENDNAPFFEKAEYYRLINEKVTSFIPRFFVKAYDVDGEDQGGGKITYSISDVNSQNKSIFEINTFTGEMFIKRPLAASDTPNGQYEIVIKATDYGSPPLSNSTTVIFRVGVSGNQRPVFKGNHIDGNGRGEYTVTVPEDLKPGSDVIQLSAIDPDGLDSLLSYDIVEGDTDKFSIDNKSGLLRTATDATLDLETGEEFYKLTIKVTDSGQPIPESSTIIVLVTIRDINNKSPKFIESATDFIFASEKTLVNTTVAIVKAVDPDLNSSVRYEIIKPLKLFDKNNLLTDSNEAIFIIDSLNGTMKLNKHLDYEKSAIITVTIRAFDTNAANSSQQDFEKITIYVQKYADNHPIFLNAGWSIRKPVILTKIDEEIPIGIVILKLMAINPLKNESIGYFRLTASDNDLLSVLSNGEIILTKKLDYENLTKDILNVHVQAINTKDNLTADAKVVILINNINDNKPIFKKTKYYTQVLESIRYPDNIITLEATDADYPKIVSSHSNSTKRNGIVSYSLLVNYNEIFQINATSGLIQLKPNRSLDREKDRYVKLIAIASDNGLVKQKTEIDVVIEVLDVNDNEPTFPRKDYTAVISEDVRIGKSVVNVTAYDLDEGLGEQVFHSIIEENDAEDFFVIDGQTGELKTKRLLNGKGRTRPYKLRIKAEDTDGLFSETDLNVFIADVHVNDGVPSFIKPEVNETIEIAENLEKGTIIYQIIATDPDDPRTLNGQLTYQLLEDGRDYKDFDLDKTSGLLRTKQVFDRETKSTYTIIAVVSDNGKPTQKSSRVIQIIVTDIDDNEPKFLRKQESPLVFTVDEEISIDSVVGEVEAIDEDIDENGLIDYAITDGNEKNLFVIEKGNKSKTARIRTLNRIDHEQLSEVLLTIKCYKATDIIDLSTLAKDYSLEDPSQIQVRIIIRDIDDNDPIFANENESNHMIGINSKIATLSTIASVQAYDIDSSTIRPIEYCLFNCSYHSKTVNSMDLKLIDKDQSGDCRHIFTIDSKNGALRTAATLKFFNNGYFNITIEANNGKSCYVSILVFVLHEKNLMKFVYDQSNERNEKKFTQIRNEIKKRFKKETDTIDLQSIQPIQRNNNHDNCLTSLDKSCCFQLIRDMKMLTKDETLNILEGTKEFETIRGQFNITHLESCYNMDSLIQKEMTLSQIALLLTAFLIGILSLITFYVTTFISYKKLEE